MARKRIAEFEGLRVWTERSETLERDPWFADVKAGFAGARLGASGRWKTEQQAVEHALDDARRRLEALADRAREAMRE